MDMSNVNTPLYTWSNKARYSISFTACKQTNHTYKHTLRSQWRNTRNLSANLKLVYIIASALIISN